MLIDPDIAEMYLMNATKKSTWNLLYESFYCALGIRARLQ